MRKLLFIVPLLLIGCMSAKTRAKIESAFEEGVKATTSLCSKVLYRRKEELEQKVKNCEKSFEVELAKCGKAKKYWEDEYKELVTPK